ncbi:Retrovirus-related Pol polyprotein from transposon 17.6, partial [Mucuna pruriens]
MCTDYTDLNRAYPKDPYPLPSIDRLVDEVYVDDMVVKSEKEDEHCEALKQVFKTLRDHQLRLNLEKCSFGVEAGKFLGFMLTERGIEANLDKCQAIINMRSPQGVKEVQQLMGRVTTLSRFIPRSAETTQPIFGALRKGGSAVLVQERDGEQRPVYFVSKVLQGPETRYQRIKKAALALVTTSRRLRPYFKNFSIIVRTDLPICQVLGKPDLAERMVAWSVQLLEFDILFESRGHIEAQLIADFLVELTLEGGREVEGEWYLLVDGSSNHTGSGAGIILEGPTGVLIEQSLHFEFRANNNQAEYEALLAGMKLAQELGTKKLTAKSDSKLVTGQINGDYQAKDPQLAKYRERSSAMASSFDSFVLLHVPRDQNERVDLLAKLAST